MNGMVLKVDDILSDLRGLLWKMSVRFFCLEKMRMMNVDSLIFDKVIERGMVKLEVVVSGCGEVKVGFELR